MPDQPRHTGGMLALVPDEPQRLAVKGGDPPQELHCTLLFLGDDVTTWPAQQTQRLRELVTASAPALDPVDARIIGHTVLNPDRGPDGDTDPATVYLLGDAAGLGPLRRWAQWAMTSGDDYPTPPEQFDPVIFHITAGYNLPLDALTYTGPVRLSTLRLALGDDVLDMPLGGEPPASRGRELTFTPPRASGLDEGKALTMTQVRALAATDEPGARWARTIIERKDPAVAYDVEIKRDVSTDERRKLRFAGHTLSKDSDSYPIANLSDLGNAIAAYGRAKPGDRPALKRHLMKEARRLKAGKYTIARIERLGDQGKSYDGPIEYKVKSPDPRAARLRRYWARGKGRAKWRPGIPGDFKRLRRQLAKYVKTPRILNGLTANIHKMATGKWPGRGRGHGKALADFDSVEVKDIEVGEGPNAVADAERELFAGFEEWGAIFAEEDVDGYDFADSDDDGDDDDGGEADTDGDGGDGDGGGKDASTGVETKTADVDPDLLETSRLALLGEQLGFKAADDEDREDRDTGDDADDLESYEEIVGRDDQWEMDPGGTMHRVGSGGPDEDEDED